MRDAQVLVMHRLESRKHRRMKLMVSPLSQSKIPFDNSSSKDQPTNGLIAAFFSRMQAQCNTGMHTAPLHTVVQNHSRQQCYRHTQVTSAAVIGCTVYTRLHFERRHRNYYSYGIRRHVRLLRSAKVASAIFQVQRFIRENETNHTRQVEQNSPQQFSF